MGFRVWLGFSCLLKSLKKTGSATSKYSGSVQFPDSKSRLESRVCVPLSGPAHAGNYVPADVLYLSTTRPPVVAGSTRPLPV